MAIKSVGSLHDRMKGECLYGNQYVGTRGDAERVRELLRGKGIDVDKVEFVEREEAQSDHASSSNVNGQLK